MNKIMNRQRGIYIHLPLCDYKCPYCNFDKSMLRNKKYVNLYIDGVIKEINSLDINEPINTIYIGGGSPNSISDELIEKLLYNITKKVDVEKIAEYTIEAKPNELSKKRILILKKYGINRISMPIQPMNKFEKDILGLIYSEEEVDEAINNLKNEGIYNINVDLLFPIKKEQLTLQEIIKKINKYDISHITCYPVEELVEYSEIYQEELYREIISELENSRYAQYDLVHFSKEGFENIHNSNYWRRSEYYGIGAGAHSFIDGKRYSNIVDIEEYIYNIGRKISVIQDITILSVEDAIEEEFFLGLQLLEGINLYDIGEQYGEDILKKYYPIIEKHILCGNFKLEKNILKFTKKGILKSNDVLSDFLIF